MVPRLKAAHAQPGNKRSPISLHLSRLCTHRGRGLSRLSGGRPRVRAVAQQGGYSQHSATKTEHSGLTAGPSLAGTSELQTLMAANPHTLCRRLVPQRGFPESLTPRQEGLVALTCCLDSGMALAPAYLLTYSLWLMEATPPPPGWRAGSASCPENRHSKPLT